MSENVRYLDSGRYDELTVWEARTRARHEASGLAQRDVAAALLYREARLLDQRAYEDWLALYSEDCLYWVPAESDGDDPRRQASVHFDDRRRLLDRIALIRTGYLHAQTPPSRTSRILGNIETWPAGENGLEVRSTLTLCECRQGHTTVYAGAQDHLLVRRGQEWLIRHKIIRLINSTEPLGNLTFIL